VSRRLAVAVAAALTLAVPAVAVAELPTQPSGSVVGEGKPFKAYASITPTVHLFGDELTARLAVVADSRWIDPARLHVTAEFEPYEALTTPALLRVRAGRFEQLTWTWTLRCTTTACVPRLPPSDRYHVFHFRPAQIAYVRRDGRPAYGISASWPPIEVVSQISPGVIVGLGGSGAVKWRYHLVPVSAPEYRISPTLLVWLAAALALVAAAGAGLLGRSWYRTVRRTPVAVVALAPVTTLERALALLRWAHEHGDETLQRKAFERVAGELGVEAADELTRTARELAWSPRSPEDEEVEAFAKQALGSADPPP
jgi:hypothetical protein